MKLTAAAFRSVRLLSGATTLRLSLFLAGRAIPPAPPADLVTR